MVNALDTGPEPIVLKARDYQKQAISNVVGFTKDLVKGNLENNGFFKSAALLEMATGSGKTFTSGQIIEKLIKLRNRYNQRNNTKYFEGLNIFILTNRIDGLDQFKNDLVHGRKEENKSPIISEEILNNLSVTTYHSRADDLKNLSKEEDFKVKEETFGEQSGKRKDNIYCSTFQTAILKDFKERISHTDIILIDEAHNITDGKGYKSLIKDLNKKGRDGIEPLIIPITATPSDITKAQFGEPVYEFGLAKFLASKYSPSVEYTMISSTEASPEEIKEISEMIEKARNIENVKEKRDSISKIEEKFKEVMAKFPNTKELVKDLLGRITENNEIGETIIYVNSIAEADKVALEINNQAGESVAQPYHSKNKKSNALSDLSNPENPCKIVIAVDKLNESIDLPIVKNIVFWRDTNVPKVFFQQFGRGLRGTGLVKYFDYVCGLKNISWLGNIIEEFKSIIKAKKEKKKTDQSEIDNTGTTDNSKAISDKFKVKHSQMYGSDHTINLAPLGIEICELKEEIKKDITDKEIREEFFNYEGKTKEEAYKHFMSFTNRDIVMKIRFFGLTIDSIATKLLYKRDGGSLRTPKYFKKFINWLFGKEVESVEKKKITTKEGIDNFLFNYKGKNKEEAYELLMNISTNKEIESIPNISNFTKICGYNKRNIENFPKDGDRIKRPKHFKKFVNWRFGKDLDENINPNKKDIENFLFNYGGRTKEEAFIYFMSIGIADIKLINFNGIKVTEFPGLCGYNKNSIPNFTKNSKRVSSPVHFQIFIKWLFGKTIEENKKHSKKDIENFLFNYGGRTKEEAYKYFMSIGEAGIKLIDIDGIKATNFPEICNYNKDSIPNFEENSRRLNTPKHFKIFIKWIFGKKIETEEIITKEMVQEKFFNYEGRNKNDSYVHLMSLKGKDIRKINFFGKLIDSLSAEIGYEKKGESLREAIHFQKFINWLFDEKED